MTGLSMFKKIVVKLFKLGMFAYMNPINLDLTLRVACQVAVVCCLPDGVACCPQ
jgi:hypothetical protein